MRLVSPIIIDDEANVASKRAADDDLMITSERVRLWGLSRLLRNNTAGLGEIADEYV